MRICRIQPVLPPGVEHVDALIGVQRHPAQRRPGEPVNLY
jgi:hypothetical protein